MVEKRFGVGQVVMRVKKRRKVGKITQLSGKKHRDDDESK